MFKHTFNTRKRYITSLAILWLLLCANFLQVALAADNVIATRVWPSQDYTRITLESAKPFTYKMQVIENPDRVVLDIENIELSPLMKSFNDKVLPSDPYIKQIRVAKFQQNTVRLVVDLKNMAKANAFSLKPMSEYQHRLVLDILPLQDPIMAMLAEREKEQSHDISSTKIAETTDTSANELPAQSSTQVEVKPVEVATIKSEQTKTDVIKIKPTEPASSEAKSSEQKSEVTKTVENKIEEPVEQAKSETKPEIKKSGRQIIIAIDAGHGGEDPGARGASGSREKDITLTIAKKLKEMVDAEPNMQAVLTRDSDFFIPLHDRVVKARAMQADLFISIHADAFTNQAARGSSVFALSEKGATSASARYLAKKENESDLIGGVSLRVKDPILAKTLLDLSQTATINDSLKLGKAVLTKIGDVNKLHKNHVEQAGFAVLKSPDIPSILVETAFISNPEEERKLNDEVYQIKLVTSILAGVKKYFSSNPALAKTKGAQD